MTENQSAGGIAFPDAEFRTSSFSNPNNCVAVAFPQRGTILVRDSKRSDGPVLTFNSAEWSAFVEGVRAGEFDEA